MGDNDKPFACLEPGCGMRFANEDHLSVHRMKHQMSLTLTPGAKFGSLLSFVDQTPTPTKFLRNCEEIGLFNELSNNPFEEAFKKATIKHPEHLALPSGGSHAQDSLNTPSLNTPTPLALQHLALVSTSIADTLHTPNLLRTGSPAKKVVSPLRDQPPLPGPNSETASTIGSTPGEETCQSLPDTENAAQGFALTSPTSSKTESLATAAVPSATRPTILGSSARLKRHRSSSNKSVESPGISEKKRIYKQLEPASEVSSSDEMTIIEEEEVVSQVAPSPGSASSQIMSPMSMIGSPGGLPAIAAAPSPIVPTIDLSKSQSQYMLQVMVQMPGGQMMPVHIPAALANTASPTTTTAAPTVTKATEVQPRSLPVTVAPAVSSVSSTSSTASIKQKLKDTIRQNAQHHILTDNMRVISEAAEIAAHDIVSYNGSSLLPMKLGTIKTELMQSALRPGQVAPPAHLGVVQREAADTSTPSSSQLRLSTELSGDDSEERRTKFLERNRAAAARCRTKKKIWTNNLEKKAEEFQKANAALQSEVSVLRGEVTQLKSLLLAHRDCPVTAQQQRSGQLAIQPVGEVIHTDHGNNIIISTETASRVVTMAASPLTKGLHQVGPVILNVRSLNPSLKPEKS